MLKKGAMVYKKYIKRGNKIYGPYLYHSVKKKGKVTTHYLGRHDRHQTSKKVEDLQKRHTSSFGKKHSIRFFLAVGFLSVLIIALTINLIFLIQLVPSARVTFDVQDVYSEDSYLTGEMRLILKHGELMPLASSLIINNAGEESEFLLSDLFAHNLSEGNFYVENTDVSGFGEGYGVLGEREIYPSVYVKFRVVEKGAEVEPPVTEGEGVELEPPAQEPEENITEIEENITKEVPEENITEPEIPLEENITEEVPEQSSSEEPSPEESVEEVPEEPASESSEEPVAEEPEPAPEPPSEPALESPGEPSEPGPGITGGVISGEIIEVNVSKNESFVYELESGQTIEIIESGQEVSFIQNENVIIISTEYFEIEQGFGLEYLADELFYLPISVTGLNLQARDGEVVFSFVYEDEIMTSASMDVHVAAKEINMTEVNVTENITEVNITIEEPVINVTYDAPLVTLLEPDDNAFTSDNVTFKCHGVDDQPIKEVSLWINLNNTWHKNQVIQMISENVSVQNETESNIPEFNVTENVTNETQNFSIKDLSMVYSYVSDNSTNTTDNITESEINGSLDNSTLDFNITENIPEEIGPEPEPILHEYTAEFNITGISNGTYVWNCEVENNESQRVFALENRTVNVGASRVTLISPFENYTINVSNITFVCEIYTLGNETLESVSLFGNWEDNWSLINTFSIADFNTSLNSSDVLFNHTNASITVSFNILDIPLGVHSWNCRADFDNFLEFALNNRTFYIGNYTVEENVTLGYNWIDYDYGDGTHNQIIYSYVMNMPDENGDFKPINNVLDFKYENDEFKLKWHDKSLSLRPFVVYKDKEYLAGEIDQIDSRAKFSAQIDEREGYHYVMDVSLPDRVKNDVEYVGLELVNLQNINEDEIMVDDKAIYLPDLVMLDFSDLIINDFDLEFSEKSKLLIGNVKGENDLHLDPFVKIDYTAAEDNHLKLDYYGFDKDKNYGGSTLISLAGGSTTTYRPLIRFNLSSIPFNTNVFSANLSLYALVTGSSCSTDQSWNIYEVLVSWAEGSASGEVQNGASCWYSRNWPHLNWTIGGCSGSGTDKEGVYEDTVYFGSGNGWRYWQIPNMVQDWVFGNNYGAVLQRQGSGVPCTYSAYSSEATETTKPYLNVSYTVRDDIVWNTTNNCTITSTENEYYHHVNIYANCNVTIESGGVLNFEGVHFYMNETLNDQYQFKVEQGGTFNVNGTEQVNTEFLEFDGDNTYKVYFEGNTNLNHTKFSENLIDVFFQDNSINYLNFVSFDKGWFSNSVNIIRDSRFNDNAIFDGYCNNTISDSNFTGSPEFKGSSNNFIENCNFFGLVNSFKGDSINIINNSDFLGYPYIEGNSNNTINNVIFWERAYYAQGSSNLIINSRFKQASTFDGNTTNTIINSTFLSQNAIFKQTSNTTFQKPYSYIEKISIGSAEGNPQKPEIRGYLNMSDIGGWDIDDECNRYFPIYAFSGIYPLSANVSIKENGVYLENYGLSDEAGFVNLNITFNEDSKDYNFTLYVDDVLIKNITFLTGTNPYGIILNSIDMEFPEVSLISPENDSIIEPDIMFKCDGQDNLHLTEASLWGNWNSGWHKNQSIDFSEEDWLAGFGYRMPINISNLNQTIDLVDYEINLSVYTKEIQYFGKMQQDCEDVRFVYYNATSQVQTEIPFWIEECNSNGDSVFWVKIPYIEAGGSAIIYLYYGNPDVQNASDKQATFLFVEDFNDNVINDSKWEVLSGNGEITEENGQMHIEFDNGLLDQNWWDTRGAKVIRTEDSLVGDWEAVVWMNSLIDPEHTTHFGISVYHNDSDAWLWGRYEYLEDGFVLAEVGNSSQRLSGAEILPVYLRIRKIGDSKYFSYSYDKINWYISSGKTDHISDYLVLFGREWYDGEYSFYGSVDAVFDDVLIHRIIEPEPEYAVGSEENYLVQAYNASFNGIINNEGNYLWNCEFCDVFDNCGQAEENWTFYVTEFPEVSLISPENDSNLYGNVLFACNASDGNGLSNISLFGNWEGGWDEKMSLEPDKEAVPDSSDIVLLMHFNNDSEYGENDTHVYDFSENGNNGTVTGAVLTDGKYDKAFYFDGNGDYVLMGDDNSLDYTNISIFMWVNFSAVYNSRCLLSKKTVWDGNGFYLEHQFGSTRTIFVGASGAPYAQWIWTPIANQWYHLAFVVQENSIEFYLNGTSQGSRAINPITSTFNDLYLGAFDFDSSEFAGEIDELIIYNRTLNPQEVSKVYGGAKEFYQAEFNVSNLEDGSYEWNCKAYDFVDSFAWAEKNYTLSISQCVPPDSGDWEINATCILEDEDILLDGDLIVSSNGELVLKNLAFTTKSTIVEKNGVIILENVEFVTGETMIQEDASLSAVDSKNTIWQNGDLTISGKYSLNNSILRMNGSSDGEVGINVTGTGSFYIQDKDYNLSTTWDSSVITKGIDLTDISYIYQEDADEIDCDNEFCDGNWETYYSYPGYSKVYYFNYSIPYNAVGAIWGIKVIGLDYNATIPDSCLNSGLLQLKVIQYYNSFFQCWNGSNWVDAIGSPLNPNLYEEAIWWELAEPSGGNYFFIVEDGANFSMKNSFLSYAGWEDVEGQRGLEIYTPLTEVVGSDLRDNYYGISFYSDNNTIENNTISFNDEVGLYFLGSDNNTILDNYFRYNDDNVHFRYSYYNNFSSNTLDDIRSGSTNANLFLDHSSNNKITNNTLFGGQRIVYLDGYSVGDCQNNIISYNQILGDGGSNSGIYLDRVGNNTISNNDISYTNYGISFVRSQDNLVIDSQILNSNSKDIRSISPDIFSNNTLLNVTFNKSKVLMEEGVIYVKWYLDVYVNDTIGSPVSGANVIINDTNENNVFNDVTGETGFIERQNLTEYFHNTTGPQYVYNNYTFYAENNFRSDTKSVNVTESRVGNNAVFLTIDLQSPEVFLISPENGFVSSTSDVSFECNATDNKQLKNISLYSNFSWEYNYDSSMVLWMHFNNDSDYGENDTHVYDFSENGNNGTVTGAVLTDGKYGKAFYFDGDNDWMVVYDNDGLDFNNDITMEAWAYLRDKSDSRYILQKGQIGASEYALYYELDRDRFVFRSGAEQEQIIFSNMTPSLNRWYHVVGVMVNDSGIVNMSIYVDGNLENLNIVPDFSLAENDKNLHIGSYSGVATWNGTIDEIAIYNRRLSDSEILAHYQGGEWRKITTDSISGIQNSSKFDIVGLPYKVYEWNCEVCDASYNCAFNNTNWTLAFDSCLIPEYGDWYVSGNCSFQDQTIILDGDLIVQYGGNLTFNNVTFRINGSSFNNGEYGIRVENGGGLHIKNESNITNGNDGFYRYSFIVEDGAVFEMTDSYLSYAGWEDDEGKRGLEVYTVVTEFYNNWIENNYIGLTLYSNNNLIRDNVITSNLKNGVLIINADENVISNNIINLSGNYGIWIESTWEHSPFGSVNSNNISYNNLQNNTNGDIGLISFVVPGINNIIEKNVLSSPQGSFAKGIYVFASNQNKVLKNNLSGGGVAIHLNNSDSNEVADNKVSGSGRGLLLSDNSLSNTLRNNTLFSNDYGVWFLGGQGNVLLDSVISNSINEDVYSEGNSNNTLLNTVFNKSNVQIDDGVIYIQWYLDVNVTNKTGNELKEVNVSSWDINTNLVFSENTTSFGFIERQNLTEYFHNTTGPQYVYNNYTITALKDPYWPFSGELNLTNSTRYDIIIRTNDLPVVSNVILSSSSGYNRTNDNLSVYYDSYDIDNDPITNITDWRLNGTSIAVLNMPFDTQVDSTELGAVRDYSVYGNNGTIGEQAKGEFGPVWTNNGKVGGGYEFDGEDDNINISQIFDIVQGGSVEVWFKPANLNGGEQTILTSTYASDSKFQIMLEADVLSAHFYVGASRGKQGTISGTGWHHAVFVWNGTEYFYIDGVSQSSNSNMPAANVIGTFVGMKTDYSSFFNGTIDEVKIYNISLNAEQVNFNYQAGLAGHHVEKIVSQETSVGDIWQVAVTPNDVFGDGMTVLSNELGVNDTGLKVNCTSPVNGAEWPTYNVNFSCDVTDTVELKNITFYGNFTWEYQEKDSMVLWMHFNNDSDYGENDMHVYDFSGNGNNGTVTGASITDYSRFIKALRFNWDGGNITIPDSILNLNSELSFEAWIRPKRALSTFSPIMDNGEFSIGLNFSDFRNARLTAGINTIDNGWGYVNEPSQFLWTQGWHHLAFTYNGTSNISRLFRDGKMVAELIGIINGSVESVVQDLVIGQSVSDYYFGVIDELAIYNTTLSANEIGLHYNGTWQEFAFENLSGIQTTSNFLRWIIEKGTYEWDAYACNELGFCSWDPIEPDEKLIFSIADNAAYEEGEPCPNCTEETGYYVVNYVNVTPQLAFTLDNLVCDATLVWNGFIEAYWFWLNGSILSELGYLYNENGVNGTIATLSHSVTSKNDTWECIVIPGDGYKDYGELLDSVKINNTFPNVSLYSPPDNSSFTNRTPTFEWEGYDADGDSLTYELFIDGDCGGDDRRVFTNDSNHTPTVPLQCLQDDDYSYTWKVRASDDWGINWGNWSEEWNFNVTSLISINLIEDFVHFGSLKPGETNDTETFPPVPFLLENNGSVCVNITINATNLFITAPNPTGNFTFKADINEFGSFDWEQSTTDWTPVPAANTPEIFLVALNWSDDSDTAEIDLNVTVPNEQPGSRSSIVQFTAYLGE